MVRIIIIRFQTIPHLFQFFAHSVAIITDLDSKQTYKVSHDGIRTSLVSLTTPLDIAQFYGNSRIKKVTLYSHQKNLECFLNEFNTRYTTKNFCFLTHNCSHAVDFVLDYFFRDATFEKCLYTTFKILCGAGSLLTLGLLTIPPTPPGIHSPSDVYKRAKLLESRYGSCDKVSERQPNPTSL